MSREKFPSRGGGIQGRDPARTGHTTFLIEETKQMERNRRMMEQDGERRLARVHAREHAVAETQAGDVLESTVDNGLLQHPEINNQHFDGMDPTVNPAPNYGGEKKTKYENERRTQEQEKQLRLGNMPRYNNSPRPKGP